MSKQYNYTIKSLRSINILENYGTPGQTLHCMRGICYYDFSTDNWPTCLLRMIVRYTWWFVGIGGLQCLTIGTWIIIGGSPLENFQSIWRSISRRNAMDSTGDSSVAVPHCSATDSAQDFILFSLFRRQETACSELRSVAVRTAVDTQWIFRTQSLDSFASGLRWHLTTLTPEKRPPKPCCKVI